MGSVTAICISEKRGTAKQPVPTALLVENHGLQGDAHAGPWHRQVSLLSAEAAAEFAARGPHDLTIKPGAFGENLLVQGLAPHTLPVGTLLACGGALLELTQLGKACHDRCAIYHTMGDCIMPRLGVFARVLRGGAIAVGDPIAVVPRPDRLGPRPWQAAVITLSDKGAAGKREDQSGPAVAARLTQNGYEVAEQLLLPDDAARLQAELIRLADHRRLDLILTTGGTGFSPRDTTPEATLAVAHRQVPGIAEAMRAASMAITPRAMLSRAVAVIRGKTLIINLPGSPKACLECMDVFMQTIPHGLALLRNEVEDCAR